MRPYQSRQVAAGLLAAVFTLCMSTAENARAQGGTGRRARGAAASRGGRTQTREADEKARAFLEEGQRRADEGKWDEALQAYRQALAIDPRYGDAYIGMGDAYMSAGKYKEGFAAYEQAVSVAPSNPDAHYSLGAAYNDMAMYGDAFKPFVQAIRLDPGFAEAHYGIGYAYLRLDNFRDALVYLRQAVRLRPDYTEAHLALGQTHLGLRNAKAAEGELKILADLDPASARVLEKDIREAAAFAAQEAARPAAPARSEQATTPTRTKPSMPSAAPAASEEAAPRQAAQAPRVKPKSTEESAASPPRQASPPAAAQTQNAAFELSFWDSIKDSTDPEEFAAYIKKYPDGQFVELARIRMHSIESKRGVPKEPGGASRWDEAMSKAADGTKQQQNATTQQEAATKPQEAATKQETVAKPQPVAAIAQAQPERAPTATTQQPPSPAPETTATPSAEQAAKPSAEQQPSKPSIEQPAQVAAAAQPLKESAAKEKEPPVEEQPVKEQPVEEQPVKEQPVEEKRVAAVETDEVEAVTTVEGAASLLRKLFPSRFTYRMKTNGGAHAAPAASEVSINYEPLYFDGCQLSWHDSNDTLSVSLSDLDAGTVTVSPRVKPSTTFSIEVWNVTIATEGGRGAISEEKGDGSGAVNVYNGLDLQYDSRPKADGLAKALRRAIKLCAGKM